VNTSDILASFLALFLIGRPRSGASVALQSLSQVSKGSILSVVGVSLVCVGCSACVAWYSGPVIEELFSMVDSRLLFGLAGLSLVSVTFVLTGPMGLLVLAVSSLVGMAALVSGSRAVCMSVLIVPSILLFSGLQLI
jgi:putative membrane protein